MVPLSKKVKGGASYRTDWTSFRYTASRRATLGAFHVLCPPLAACKAGPRSVARRSGGSFTYLWPGHYSPWRCSMVGPGAVSLVLRLHKLTQPKLEDRLPAVIGASSVVLWQAYVWSCPTCARLSTKGVVVCGE